jgi:GNAT superfamily N-acetyltransferase
MTYSIRPARRTEAGTLRDIERAAGRAFIAAGYPDVAAYEPTHGDDLRDAVNDGMLFVAADMTDWPVGFVFCATLDHGLYVQEINVHPDHAGHRLAIPLLEAADDLARQLDLPALLLTTFRTVPWNAPYYARLGFSILPEAAIGPDLQIVIARQRMAGLDISARVAMRRLLERRVLT